MRCTEILNYGCLNTKSLCKLGYVWRPSLPHRARHAKVPSSFPQQASSAAAVADRRLQVAHIVKRSRLEGDVTVQAAAAAAAEVASASVFAYVASGFLIASLIAAKK